MAGTLIEIARHEMGLSPLIGAIKLDLLREKGHIGEWIKREWPAKGRAVIDNCTLTQEIVVFPEEVYIKDSYGNLTDFRREYRCSVFPNGCCISKGGQAFKSQGAHGDYCD